jgi:hypothetical protein
MPPGCGGYSALSIATIMRVVPPNSAAQPAARLGRAVRPARRHCRARHPAQPAIVDGRTPRRFVAARAGLSQDLQQLRGITVADPGLAVAAPAYRSAGGAGAWMTGRLSLRRKSALLACRSRLGRPDAGIILDLKGQAGGSGKSNSALAVASVPRRSRPARPCRGQRGVFG